MPRSDRLTRIALLAAVALLGCRPVSNRALLAGYDGRKYHEDHVIACDDLEPTEPDECIELAILDLQTCLELDHTASSSPRLDDLSRALLVEYRSSGLTADDADRVVAIAESIAGEALAAAVRRCFDGDTLAWDCAPD